MDPAIIYMALPTHFLYKADSCQSWYRFARQLINTTKKNQDITHEHYNGNAHLGQATTSIVNISMFSLAFLGSGHIADKIRSNISIYHITNSHTECGVIHTTSVFI